MQYGPPGGRTICCTWTSLLLSLWGSLEQSAEMLSNLCLIKESDHRSWINLDSVFLIFSSQSASGCLLWSLTDGSFACYGLWAFLLCTYWYFIQEKKKKKKCCFVFSFPVLVPSVGNHITLRGKKNTHKLLLKGISHYMFIQKAKQYAVNCMTWQYVLPLYSLF